MGKTGEGSGTDIAVVTDRCFCQLSNAKKPYERQQPKACTRYIYTEGENETCATTTICLVQDDAEYYCTKYPRLLPSSLSLKSRGTEF